MRAASAATVYIDGASRGNPGRAAVGVVFQDGEGRPTKVLSKAIGVATNNAAEYFALLFAMQEALMMRVEEIHVFTDSELVAKQFSGEYRVKDASLKLLYFLVEHLRSGFRQVTVAHVPRERNRLADKEANRALDEASLL